MTTIGSLRLQPASATAEKHKIASILLRRESQAGAAGAGKGEKECTLEPEAYVAVLRRREAHD
ncbi:MAG: hypothetical protein AB1555_02120 [Nitrospirota bacterium]